MIDLDISIFINEEEQYYTNIVNKLEASEDCKSKGALKYFKRRLKEVKRMKKEVIVA